MLQALKTWACAKKIFNLLQQLERRFEVFDKLETQFKIFRSPFSVTPTEVPIVMQLEIIDLQCDSNLKENIASDRLEIHKYLFTGYLQIVIPNCQNLVHVRNYLPRWCIG